MVVPMKIADVFADLPEVETERLLLRRLTRTTSSAAAHRISTR